MIAMEWVETTAKTLEEAKELALDRLGVAADDAEFEVLEAPRPGLFGRLRGEARVRARVMPTAVRPKQDRRGRARKDRDGRGKGRGRQADDERSNGTDIQDGGSAKDAAPPTDRTPTDTEAADTSEETREPAAPARGRSKQSARSKPKQSSTKQKEQHVSTQDAEESQVSPTEVAAAAETFMSGLVSAFGVTAETNVEVDGSDIDVRISGSGLGLMVGHGGRTLLAVQDLARVASQRRLGDHETRLRIDIAAYREKRNEALSRFATSVANKVVESGEPKALEPMQSADRKVVHDALASVEGVTSRSEGDDPMRRVIISPA